MSRINKYATRKRSCDHGISTLISIVNNVYAVIFCILCISVIKPGKFFDILKYSELLI